MTPTRSKRGDHISDRELLHSIESSQSIRGMGAHVELSSLSEAERGDHSRAGDRSKVNRRKRANGSEVKKDDAYGLSVRPERQEGGNIGLPIHASISVILLLVVWCALSVQYAASMRSFVSAPQRLQPSMGFAIQTSLALSTLQMLAGAAIGLIVLSMLYQTDIVKTLRGESKRMLFIGFIHALSSNCQSLGFLHGTASLIQVIQVMQPFTTLGWSIIFREEPSRSLRHSSSILIIVGGAMAVVTSQATPPNAVAVVCALLTVTFLPVRNIMLRGYSNNTIEATIARFTTLSLSSAVWCSLGTVLALILVQVDSSESSKHLLGGIGFGPALFHPGLTLASMTLLTILSATTHSILNVAKRILSVLGGVIFLDEAFSKSSIAGFIATLFGGFSYGYARIYDDNDKNEKALVHPLIALAIITCLFFLPGEDDASDY